MTESDNGWTLVSDANSVSVYADNVDGSIYLTPHAARAFALSLVRHSVLGREDDVSALELLEGMSRNIAALDGVNP